MDRDKILKMIVILAAIVVIAGSLSRLATRNSMSLSEYASLNGNGSEAEEDGADGANASSGDSDSNPSGEPGNPAKNPSDESELSEDISSGVSGQPCDGSSNESGRPGDGSSSDSGRPGNGFSGNTERPGNSSSGDSGRPGNGSSDESGQPGNESSDGTGQPGADSSLIGASLNGTSQLEQRVLLAEGFYYEPISDNLRRYMTGISFPVLDDGQEGDKPEITFEELMYVHILHYDFDGNSTEGELICNAAIASDLTEIFQELYRNEYRLEKVLLIEAYDGDDTASMEDNNTSCFNYRPVEGSGHLSKHAYGLAIDINPLYNPYITYAQDGTEEVSPPSALPYADRSARFPYKIDENDLCYKLFTSYGFTWGGNWNSVKDYQHFQKAN